MKDICKTCNKEFTHRSHAHRVYCSLRCQKNGNWYKEMKKLHVGKSSWNKGKPAPWVIIPIPRFGSDNHKWKGNKVGYDALHRWVQRKLGRAFWCTFCFSMVRVQWANVSKQYKRDLNDWIQLCYRCHHKFDNNQSRGWETRRRVLI